MKKFVTILMLFSSSFVLAVQLSPEDRTVGTYKLHFNQQGELIEPDEYYIFHGVNDDADGFKKSARKQFQRAASYGNTFGFYFAGLLYLQQNDNIKGYAWLSMVDNKNFPYAEKVESLLAKLEANFDQDALQQGKEFIKALDEYYGIEATFERRLKWSKNFKLTGSHIKGRIPNNLSIQTDLSSGSGEISKWKASVSASRLKRSINNFVYEYEMDLRIREGVININDIELIEE